MAEFTTVKKVAADYVKDTSCNLMITNADEANKRIHFASCDSKFTFYVSCPTTENASWNIWSDNSDSQQALQYVLDSCNLSSEKSIASLLETVSKRLKTVSGMESCKSSAASSPGNNEEDDYDEDDDDDDDDVDNYYADEDADAVDDVQVVKTSKEQEEEKAIAANFFNSHGSEMAVSRLVKVLHTTAQKDLPSKPNYYDVPEQSGSSNCCSSSEADVMDAGVAVENFISTGRTGRRNAMADISDPRVGTVSTSGIDFSFDKLSVSEPKSQAESGQASSSSQPPGDTGQQPKS